MHCIRFPSPLPTLSPIHLPNHFPIGGLDSDGGSIMHWGLNSNGRSDVFLGGILSTAIVLLNCGGGSNDRIDKLWQ